MVEQQRQRVEQEITKLVDDIDKQFLRKMQGDMHRCAATCCDDRNVSLERVQQCVENCSKPLNKSQAYIQHELENYQNRLQRCVMDCNDKIKDMMGPKPSESDINKYNVLFEQCATQCVDKHVDLIPKYFEAMKNVLSKHAAEQT